MAVNFFWILIASLIGFSLAAIFAGMLKLRRNIFLLFYIPIACGLFAAFIVSSNISISDILQHNLLWGFAGAVIAALLVIRNVFSQPPSARNEGMALITDIIWPGFFYGLTDALLLSVLPILAVKSAFEGAGIMDGWMGKIEFGIISFAASILITVAYHLGYPEFRGKKVIFPAIGNGILSIAFILTMNPLAAILPHIAMHITAMIHGRETTGQVPPHYN